MHPSPRMSSRATRAFVLSALVFLAASLPAGPAATTAAAAADPAGAAFNPPHRDFDYDAVIDANQIEMVVSNFGIIGRDIGAPGGPSGTFYPADTDRTCMYTAGIWVAGKIGQETRVTVAEYQTEYSPGVILPDGGWSDPSLPRYRTYKLTSQSGPGDPDYDEWPVEDGAPLDRDGHPLVVGEQTLWSVFNDAFPDAHTSGAGGTAPIGVEVSQLTYAFGSRQPLDRVVFVDYRLIHNGAQALNPAHIGIYTDIDLGGGRDDLAGCDSLLEAGFTYNGDNWDDVYEDRPPATGFVVLKGPAHLDHPLYAAIDYVNGEDPYPYVASYNLLRGLKVDGDPMIDPVTGLPTRFWHAGDVPSGSGWVDTWVQDKRNLLSLGPFSFSPGQSESVRVAFVVGDRENRRASTADMLDVGRCIKRLNAKGAFLEPSRWAIAGFYPQPFEPSVTETGRIFILAPEEGRAFVRVYNAQNQIVRAFGEVHVSAGITPLSWDGRDDDGALVPPGTYRFVMRVVKPVLSTRQAIVDTEEMQVAGSRGPVTAGVPGRGVTAAGGLRVPSIARGGAWIGYDAAARGETATLVTIYDLAGRAVRTLEIRGDGQQQAWWDGHDAAGRRLPAGIYFVRADASGERSLSRRLLLLW